MSDQVFRLKVSCILYLLHFLFKGSMKGAFLLPGISHMTWGGHHYFLSWREPWHKFEDWDWFNGRNFCRDRCMDLVSFDTPGEYALFAAIMKKGEENANPRSEGVKPSSCSFQTM